MVVVKNVMKASDGFTETLVVVMSDISNEARPMQVAEPWIDCLLMEFFNQV